MGKLHPLLEICADDFGLSRGVNEITLQMAEAGFLDAISAVSVAPKDLSRVAELRRRGVRFGMHWMPVGPTPAPWPGLPSFVGTLLTTGRARLKTRLSSHFAAQLAGWTEQFGFAPEFVDSHMHVHQMPRVQDVFRACLIRHGLSCERATAEVWSFESAYKLKILQRFGAGFAAGRSFRPVALVLDYASVEPARVAEELLARLSEPAMLIVHPGLAEDSQLRGFDSLWRNRDKDVFLLEEISRRVAQSNAPPRARHPSRDLGASALV